MKIWVTRHGQTNLNKKELMQGLTDEPLNDEGIAQALCVRKMLDGVKFDAVYSSPLKRALKTAEILSGLTEVDIKTDDRIIEVNFGKYEMRNYKHLGPWMSLYWLWPEVIPAPPSVENIRNMAVRSASFLKELETKDYENVLIVCHGGIIRALCGYLEGRKHGIKWRPRPLNCEVRVYECHDGKHTFLASKLPREMKKK